MYFYEECNLIFFLFAFSTTSNSSKGSIINFIKYNVNQKFHPLNQNNNEQQRREVSQQKSASKLFTFFLPERENKKYKKGELKMEKS